MFQLVYSASWRFYTHQTIRLCSRFNIIYCLTPFSTLFSNIAAASAPIHAFQEFFLPLLRTIFFSKILVAFPHNYCRNNGQRRERNESYGNNHHQSSERILAEHGDRISDLLFSSPERNQLSYGTRQVRFKKVTIFCFLSYCILCCIMYTLDKLIV